MQKYFQDFHSREPVLTEEAMRGAESEAIARDGCSDFDLMERAGRSAAAAIIAYCGPSDVLVLVGPGNNGGDGYVVARILRDSGWPVRIAACREPSTDAAKLAAAAWGDRTDQLETARPASILVDALFGTGLTRGLDDALVERLHALASSAANIIALDLPSGISSDDGAILSPPIDADLTIAFGALKPSHLLYPAASSVGRLVVADIGLGALSEVLTRNGRPAASGGPDTSHKFDRGHVLVVAGTMPGACWLAARAAQRAGAGYVTVASDAPERFSPASLVVQRLSDVESTRVGAVVIGPGLGRDASAKSLALEALATKRPSVIDADMFSLFADDLQTLFGRNDVMTPHEGEFSRFFQALSGSKVERARAAAKLAGNVIVLKGADTIIAAPDGSAAINTHASPRLATAGSGDVLSGMIAAHMARGERPFEAACAAVWRHGDAGLRGRDGLVAEDLLELIR